MPLSRRDLLGGSAALAGTALAGSSLALPNAIAQRTTKRGRAPKNVIFLVVDGMATQTMTMHDHLSQLMGKGRSYWSTLLDRPDVHRGWEDTRSLSSIVTDSAAASSTWGSGRRIWNGQLNVFPDGTELRPITQLMAEKGVRCGLVTTTTITHATPAGFAISCENRDLEALIAEKYLKAGVDVFLGGGNRFFAADKRKDKKDLYAEFRTAGFDVVKDRGALMASKSKKILGVFSDSHLPYTVDRDNDPALQASVPTLAEMATCALENLKGSKNGFLLQIEGGKVDHAGHGNDLAAMLNEQRSFEEAVKVAIEFAERDGETLVIITADHATGGPTLNGAGDEYADSTAGLRSVARMKSSYAPILAEVAKSPKAETLRAVTLEKLGVELTLPEAQAVIDAVAGKSPFGLSQFHRSASSTMALVLGNTTKVGFTSDNHSDDHVMVTAFGPWSGAVVGLQPNVMFNTLMRETKGIRHENPTMTFEDAERAMRAKATDKGQALVREELQALYGAGDEIGAHRVFVR